MTESWDLSSSSAIFSVGALTELIRRNLNAQFPFLWVRGEVTDFSISPSRHIYFSLRDRDALVHCVWFAGKRQREARKFDPLTGEVYDNPLPPPEEMLSNGLELVCAGALNVYGPAGRYQIVVEHAEPAGLGALALIFEQRRARYEAAGYFAPERKRKLPFNPSRVALLTSLHGAAIHDFLKLASSRGLSAVISIYPVPVQGKGAAVEIARAIGEVNRQASAQLIVLVRGGGSREDLAEFNEEALIEAIHASRIPVVTGIGHEIDTSLADLVADARAATPSHAAQLVWPLRADLWQSLDELSISLNRSARRLLDGKLVHWKHLNQNLALLSPLSRLASLSRNIENIRFQCFRACARLIDKKSWELGRLSEKRKTAPFAEKVRAAQARLQWLAQKTGLCLARRLEQNDSALSELENALERGYASRLGNLTLQLEQKAAKLEAVNPYAPLKRGYAILLANGSPLRELDDFEAGARVTAILCEGEIEMKVMGTKRLPDICGEK